MRFEEALALMGEGKRVRSSDDTCEYYIEKGVLMRQLPSGPEYVVYVGGAQWTEVKKKCWVNLYLSHIDNHPYTGSRLFDTEEVARLDGATMGNYIKTVEVEL